MKGGEKDMAKKVVKAPAKTVVAKKAAPAKMVAPMAMAAAKGGCKRK